MGIAGAYAFVDDDKVNYNTISSTKRAAKVNALVIVFGFKVTNGWTDENINSIFNACAGPKQKIELVTVMVRHE